MRVAKQTKNSAENIHLAPLYYASGKRQNKKCLDRQYHAPAGNHSLTYFYIVVQKQSADWVQIWHIHQTTWVTVNRLEKNQAVNGWTQAKQQFSIWVRTYYKPIRVSTFSQLREVKKFNKIIWLPTFSETFLPKIITTAWCVFKL